MIILEGGREQKKCPQGATKRCPSEHAPWNTLKPTPSTAELEFFFHRRASRRFLGSPRSCGRRWRGRGMSFLTSWIARFMPKAGDANYEYNFEEVEKHRTAGERAQETVFGDTVKRERRDPGHAAKAVRMRLQQGYFLDYADLLEHRGLVVNAGLYQVIPTERAYPAEFNKLREEAEARKKNQTSV
jgi:hypothetical protein